MRLSAQEVQDLVIGTITTVKIELATCKPEDAEDTLDWCVWKLIEHGYCSAAFDLVDVVCLLLINYLKGNYEL
jgi:hypothetical protein